MTDKNEAIVLLTRAGMEIENREVEIADAEDSEESLEAVKATISELSREKVLVIRLADPTRYPDLVRWLAQELDENDLPDAFAVLAYKKHPEITCMSRQSGTPRTRSHLDFLSYRTVKPADFSDLEKYALFQDVKDLPLSEMKRRFSYETRVGIAYLADWLATYMFVQEAVSLAERLITDENSADVIELNSRLLRNESASSISGVRAAVCWCLQKLALSAPGFRESMRLTKVAMADELIYNRLQACIPLMEITKRTSVLSRPEIEDLKAAALSFLNGVAEYAAFEEYLTHVFAPFHDLSKAERVLVLGKLSAYEDVGILQVRYGLRGLNDDSSKATYDELCQFVERSDNIAAVGRAVWYMFRILNDTEDEGKRREAFGEIAPLIDKALERPFSHSIHGLIDTFSDPLAQRFPEKYVDWTLSTGSKFISTIGESSKRAVVYYKPDDVLKLCIAEKPERAKDFYVLLERAWRAGAHLGNPLELFKLVDGSAVSTTDLAYIRSIYAAMKQTNPRLDDWT
jgi:hypothetical protein